MTKSALIEAMADFPDDMPVKLGEDQDLHAVTEICPTQIGPSENYLLLSADIASSGVHPRGSEEEEDAYVDHLIDKMLDDDFERELEEKANDHQR